MASPAILQPTPENLTLAADRIRAGGIVAYPTETVYGLAVDPFDDAALRRLFDVKGRSPDSPVLVLVRDREDITRLASGIPGIAEPLLARFWPGPLTVILPARTGLPPYLTSGSGTVAVRQSSGETATDLVRAVGGPITSTSANRSGQDPVDSSGDALCTFGRDIDVILDGHCEPDARPSTIVDVTGVAPVIIREGAIASSDISF